MLKLADFKNKKALIMGLGLHGGGAGAAAFFSRLGSHVIVTDLKTKRQLAPTIAKLRRFKNITYRLGGHRPADFKIADYIIKGPGVPENSKFLKIARRAGVSILSDVEIFFLGCPAPIIGITGTKGKSTTATLLASMLRAEMRHGESPRIPRGSATRIRRGSRVWLGGNIRKSVLEFLLRVRKNDLVVLELSSFQLDSLKNSRRSPAIALITNIFPDHLNRYPSMAAYIASKANIFKFQKRGDMLFVNARDPLLRRIARNTPSRVIRFDSQKILRRYRDALAKNIPAFHIPNIAGAVAIARHTGVGERAVRTALARFRGMPGRMELVRKVRGVSFINDTTATNPTAAEQAIIATKRGIGHHGLHVIAGGYDKGLAASQFMRALRENAASVTFLPGTATDKMQKALGRQMFHQGQTGQKPGAHGEYLNTVQYLSIRDARTMAMAVRVAYRNAKRGDAVLLSPGAASFGLFRHEFDRGEKFVRAVKSLRP